MRQRARADFAAVLGTIPADPSTIPAHIVKFYDDLLAIYYPLTRCRDLDQKDWPWVAFLAEKFHKLEGRIADLENHSDPAAIIAEPVARDEPKYVGSRPDLRTLAGKAWKAEQQPVGA